MQKFGWKGKINQFMDVKKSEFIDSLSLHHSQCMNCNPSGLQVTAWENEYDTLKNQLPLLIEKKPNALEWYLVFEYELPRERGRRPDILIIAEDRIFIIECKDMKYAEQQHIDQLKAYVRDLSNYHAGSANVKFEPILLITFMENLAIEKQGVTIVSPKQLHEVLNKTTDGNLIDPDKWINSRYAPLPSLISAAKLIFDHEPLPQIRKAESLGVNDAVDELKDISNQILNKNGKHLALVTGVPGSGKTLVGLQVVYNSHNFDENKQNAVFLSGNGPLVKVLQYTLKSKVFVQDVHGFLKEYGGNSTDFPNENIIIFDEAQRAWDAERVKEKRNHSNSEPLDFLSIGEKIPNGTLLVGLIGEGQEIHLGEESGLVQWNDAIKETKGEWIVHCPSKIEHIFSDAKDIVTSEKLNLNATLRSHLAEDVDKWIDAFLNGELELAQKISMNLEKQNFNVYVTNNIDVAKNYATERYSECSDKRYGFICSSKAKNLEKYGIDNAFYAMQRVKPGPWFNDEPDSEYSCCRLNLPTTEFQCQGLELDLPIVCWGDDLYWENDQWSKRGRVRYKSKDPMQVTLNCYRVILSRGRDGMVIFVPKEGTKETFNALLDSGIKAL
ncbi:DUF2075 domain-containing protein [Methanolobus mangrovi]|uniref:DUF2075 domain-containing protein n=1 Tax=Methanolobus mangrovi TaxID=3072977 RepID=A0AA51UGB6_9EURY|nr:DNA/RNA helicase domain-containing protein [Methanolobus mangrovi]WMW22752.1 DUF2075 domain-containing protein [Methanolobus mangrovi]